MDQVEKQTSADEEVTTMSDQSPETEAQSDNPSADFVADLVEAKEQKEAPKERDPSEKVAPAHEGIVGSDFFSPDEDWTATVLGELPNGKTLQVMKKKEGTGYTLAHREGGKVDKQIDGWYTTFDKAESAGRGYLNLLWDQEDAETVSTS